jgi:hypothetical protein
VRKALEKNRRSHMQYPSHLQPFDGCDPVGRPVVDCKAHVDKVDGFRDGKVLVGESCKNHGVETTAERDRQARNAAAVAGFLVNAVTAAPRACAHAATAAPT